MEAIGRLAGGVAHDFNNILTVIVSYTDLVLAESQITGVARSDLEQVRTAADRAGALTRQLLAFSRKQVLHPEVLDLNMVVESVVAMLSRVLPTTIHLRKALDSDVHPIYADRGQLEQVLMNLAVNARDAMPDGGDLTIETGSALLDDAYVALHPGGKPGLHTVLSVRDTGMGMDADTRAQIFEPFFTTKALGQGTGLGLATVYGIIQQSGGSVYVYSELGKGTTFKVYFPVSGDTPSVAPALDVHLPEVGALKVLVVEDDLAVQGATCSVLTHLGHTVQCASNAAEALQIIRAAPERPDVVLTDAVMPGMNGLELAGILTAQYPLLAVIIMSGYTEEAVSGGREIPAGVGFVEKPFSAARIAKAFVDVRNGNPKRSPHHAAG
jgi:two-component system cell cycle sensor histidine kinase/response regulator CckA